MKVSDQIGIREEVKSPLRVGIWLAYHVTLEATEGIGVFAHNLARGLASLDQPVEVVLLTKPGEEHLVKETVDAGKGRIRATSSRSVGVIEKIRRSFLWNCYLKFEKISNYCATRAQRLRNRTWSSVQTRVLNRVGITRNRFSPPVFRKLRSLMIPVSIASVIGGRTRRIMMEELRDLTYFIARKSNLRFYKLCNSQDARCEAKTDEIVDQCDVWVIPYVGLARKFKKPTIVTIHDLVCHHFPETMTPEARDQLMKTAHQVAKQSTIAACLSNFIRDNDLYGVLKLSPKKVRVVKVAAPTDFGTIAGPESEKEFPILNQKYVFYPSAFRAYKNHELLIRAIKLLKDSGEKELQIVFTGIRQLPPKLADLIAECGVADRVHNLGRVSREMLALLYQRAFVTVVPSHYEQGSFPLMEAMYWGAPIASSSIPSLVEAFSPVGPGMRFFDPYSPEQLADVLWDFLANRETILEQQQANRNAIFDRTWNDAAREWADVFREAIAIEKQNTSAKNLSLGQVADQRRAA